MRNWLGSHSQNEIVNKGCNELRSQEYHKILISIEVKKIFDLSFERVFIILKWNLN